MLLKSVRLTNHQVLKGHKRVQMSSAARRIRQCIRAHVCTKRDIAQCVHMHVKVIVCHVCFYQASSIAMTILEA